jgi:hypothetical protein
MGILRLILQVKSLQTAVQKYKQLGFTDKLSRSAFFDEKSIPFHEQFPRSP